MKKKTIISCFAIVASFLLFTFPMKLYALNYTISFTGTGASTSVESVVVQNLTKGTTVTVPTGNVLNLTDVATSVDNINAGAENISVYPNPMQEKSTISFFSKSAGIAQINVFSLDGKKIISVSRNISQGNSSFQLLLPKGAYTIQVQGNGFSYSAKVISQINSNCKAQIVFSGNENQNTSKPQKSKSAITTMLYTADDQLLYKGISGNYSTIVTDKPTESKTINFEFVECKDADGNYYSVVKIGTQTWMAENLKTTKYKDGSLITNVTDDNSWISFLSGAYCNYNNDTVNVNVYGRLYNWYAAKSGNLAPTGWHVPSYSNEFYFLDVFLGDGYQSSIKLKSTSAGGSNSVGFSALANGYRSNNGSFYGLNVLNTGISFWTVSENDNNYGWAFSLDWGSPNDMHSIFGKNMGFSVRCIKD
jgi:uncharacterized protein (TIGR02145 family)